MKEWLEQNPNGSKVAFETYFKALTHGDKKVCSNSNDSPSIPLLFLLSTQKYKDLAAAAVRDPFTCADTVS
jgi:hypothetical protein